MQLSADQDIMPSRRIEAAGAVTIIFGVLTAFLAAAWVITGTITRTSEESLSLGEAATAILVGTAFVLLGWGVLRHRRLCTVIAAGLAVLILALQLISIFFVDAGAGSLYLLVLPLFVMTANWLAWREMRGGRE